MKIPSQASLSIGIRQSMEGSPVVLPMAAGVVEQTANAGRGGLCKLKGEGKGERLGKEG